MTAEKDRLLRSGDGSELREAACQLVAEAIDNLTSPGYSTFDGDWLEEVTNAVVSALAGAKMLVAPHRPHVVKVTPHANWRSPQWDADVPSRRAWLVDCSVCGDIADGWGYSTPGAASGVARRHETRHKAERSRD